MSTVELTVWAAAELMAAVRVLEPTVEQLSVNVASPDRLAMLVEDEPHPVSATLRLLTPVFTTTVKSLAFSIVCVLKSGLEYVKLNTLIVLVTVPVAVVAVKVFCPTEEQLTVKVAAPLPSVAVGLVEEMVQLPVAARLTDIPL